MLNINIKMHIKTKYNNVPVLVFIYGRRRNIVASSPDLNLFLSIISNCLLFI